LLHKSTKVYHDKIKLICNKAPCKADCNKVKSLSRIISEILICNIIFLMILTLTLFWVKSAKSPDSQKGPASQRGASQSKKGQNADLVKMSLSRNLWGLYTGEGEKIAFFGPLLRFWLGKVRRIMILLGTRPRGIFSHI
jgi:hypothetical protein